MVRNRLNLTFKNEIFRSNLISMMYGSKIFLVITIMHFHSSITWQYAIQLFWQTINATTYICITKKIHVAKVDIKSANFVLSSPCLYYHYKNSHCKIYPYSNIIIFIHKDPFVSHCATSICVFIANTIHNVK